MVLFYVYTRKQSKLFLACRQHLQNWSTSQSDVRIDHCHVTGSRSTVICTTLNCDLHHAQLWSAPRSNWSQYKVNGLLTAVKIKRDQVTGMWRIHYDSEKMHSNSLIYIYLPSISWLIDSIAHFLCNRRKKKEVKN